MRKSKRLIGGVVAAMCLASLSAAADREEEVIVIGSWNGTNTPQISWSSSSWASDMYRQMESDMLRMIRELKNELVRAKEAGKLCRRNLDQAVSWGLNCKLAYEIAASRIINRGFCDKPGELNVAVTVGGRIFGFELSYDGPVQACGEKVDRAASLAGARCAVDADDAKKHLMKSNTCNYGGLGY